MPNFIGKNIVNTETVSERYKGFVTVALTNPDCSRRNTPALSISICKKRFIKMNNRSGIDTIDFPLRKCTHSIHPQ